MSVCLSTTCPPMWRWDHILYVRHVLDKHAERRTIIQLHDKVSSQLVKGLSATLR